MEQKQSKKILLVDIEVDTQDASIYKLGGNKRPEIDLRIKILEEALDSAVLKLNDQYPDTEEQEVRAIVTASEHFFAKNTESTVADAKDKPRQFSEADAIYIQQELAKLSNNYRNILIIPGTVAWQELALQPAEKLPPDFHGDHSPVYSATLMTRDEFIADRKSRGIQPIAFSYDRDYNSYCQKSGDAKLFEIREQLLKDSKPLIGHALGSGAPKNDQKSKLKKLGTMYQYAEDRGLLLSRNTAYFYLNGEQRYSYHKRSDYQDNLDHGENIFVPGEKEPVIEIDGIMFGIEICLDHDGGVLKKYIEAQSQMLAPKYQAIQKGVDIHVILSASVLNKTVNQACNHAGYVIHSSSQAQAKLGRTSVRVRGLLGFKDVLEDERTIQLSRLAFSVEADRFKSHNHSGSNSYTIVSSSLGGGGVGSSSSLSSNGSNKKKQKKTIVVSDPEINKHDSNPGKTKAGGKPSKEIIRESKRSSCTIL